MIDYDFVSVNERTSDLTYSNMQIIAREVELETMRRSAPKQNASQATTTAAATTSKQKPKPQNHLQRLNTKGTNPKTKTKDVVGGFFFFFSEITFNFITFSKHVIQKTKNKTNFY